MNNIEKKQRLEYMVKPCSTGLVISKWFNHIIRSIRPGDLELHMFCLRDFQIISNLLKLNNTHPQIHEKFLKGCFSLKNNKIYLKITNRSEPWAKNKRWCILPEKIYSCFDKFNILKEKMRPESFYSHKHHFTIVWRSWFNS